MKGNRMNQSIIIIAALGIVGACYGLYVKSKNTKNTEKAKKIVLTPENIGRIEMSDIVGYFKSLHLVEGKDKPFIAQGNKILDMVEISEPVSPDKTLLLLGVLYGADNEVKDLKALCCDTLSDNVKEVLGSDHLVVLS